MKVIGLPSSLYQTLLAAPVQVEIYAQLNTTAHQASRSLSPFV
jgi:hypothetical protein